MRKLIRFICILLTILMFILGYKLGTFFYFIGLSFLLNVFTIKKYKKEIKLLPFILTIYYFLSCSYIEIIKIEFINEMFFLFKYIIFYLILPLISIISIYINIDYLFQNKENLNNLLNEKYDGMLSKKNFYLLICLILTIISIMSNISYMSYPDTNRMIELYDFKIWDSWHTLGFELFFNMSYKLFGCLFSVLFIQCILYNIIYKYALDSIYNKYKNTKIFILYGLLSLFIFVPFVYIHLAIKDTIFMISVLGFSISLFNLINKEFKLKDNIFFISCAIGLSIFRKAGNILIIFTLFILIIDALKSKNNRLKIFISSIIIMLVSLYINTGMFINYNFESDDSYIKYSTPLYMISSYIYNEENISEEDIKIIEKIMPLEDWKKAYDKYYSDTVSRTWGVIEDNVYKIENENLGLSIIKVNFDLFISDPVAYIHYLMNLDSILFEVSTPIDGYDWAPIENHAIDYNSIQKYYSKSIFYKITHYLENLSGKIPIIKDILWRGGFYQFIFILCIALLIKNENYKYIVIFNFQIINQIMLYLCIPSQDTRYILPLIISLPLLVTITFSKKK